MLSRVFLFHQARVPALLPPCLLNVLHFSIVVHLYTLEYSASYRLRTRMPSLWLGPGTEQDEDEEKIWIGIWIYTTPQPPTHHTERWTAISFFMHFLLR